jgi:hypothetical protein
MRNSDGRSFTVPVPRIIRGSYRKPHHIHRVGIAFPNRADSVSAGCASALASATPEAQPAAAARVDGLDTRDVIGAIVRRKEINACQPMLQF